MSKVSEVLEVLWCGAMARSVAATDMNDYSSRSHTIFQVNLEILNKVDNSVRKSKLSLIDLAGSEKWRSHQLSSFSSERIKELTSINKSLSVLGNCILALVKHRQRPCALSRQQAHPTRQRLTRGQLQNPIHRNVVALRECHGRNAEYPSVC